LAPAAQAQYSVFLGYADSLSHPMAGRRTRSRL
jgi:hypothetical protein